MAKSCARKGSLAETSSRKGKEGALVPSPAVAAAPAMAQEAMGSARAIYDYEARASDELTFKRHDIIEVLGQDEEDDGWYIGILNGKKGLFPNNYVQFQEKAAASSAAQQPAPSAAASTAKSAPTLPDYVLTSTFEKSYTLAETLGRGRFSQVRRCTQIPGGRSCAVKIMDLDDPELGSSPTDAEREVIAEVEVLRLVQHAGVVQLFQTFKNKQFYYLVLEDPGRRPVRPHRTERLQGGGCGASRPAGAATRHSLAACPCAGDGPAHPAVDDG